MKLLPAIISYILLAAHFFRAGDPWLMGVFLLFPFILFIKKEWPVHVSFFVLLFSSIIWIRTTAIIIMIRVSQDLPWTRMALIMSALTALTIFSAFLLRSTLKNNKYDSMTGTPGASTTTFIVTMILLAITKLKVSFPIIIIDRFFPGAGWVEILLLSVYAAWLVEKLINNQNYTKYRLSLWSAFSIVFFLQFILGLSGLEEFLQTGKLHFPIPALIVGGPIYRGSGFFMLILLGSTLLFIGPAWCSFMCYIGSWDFHASRSIKMPKPAPEWTQKMRIIILIIVILTAFLLRALGLTATTASVLAITFGIASIALMIFWSRKNGLMMHCISFCPIGIITTYIGKISPFRLSINNSCTGCKRCPRVCRYGALRLDENNKMQVDIKCTLCGDCITECSDDAIQYSFFKLSPERARELFLILIVSIHAMSLALARI